MSDPITAQQTATGLSAKMALQLDAITAARWQATLKSVQPHYEPEEREEVLAGLRAETLAAREYVRSQILSFMRESGANPPDDFGLPASEEAIFAVRH